MKIDGTKGVGQVGKSKAKKKASTTGNTNFSSLVQSSGEGDAEAIESTTPTYTVSPVSALIALQEVDQEPDDQQKAKDHGEGLLDELEQIRLGLLGGQLSYSKLQKIREMVDQKMAVENLHPDLQMVLNEIELRVRVELAKFEKK